VVLFQLDVIDDDVGLVVVVVPILTLVLLVETSVVLEIIYIPSCLTFTWISVDPYVVVM